MALELSHKTLARYRKMVEEEGDGYMYYIAWGTAAEMLYDRWYDINDDDFDITYDDFLARYGHGVSHHIDPQDLTINCTLLDSNCKVSVIFLGAATLCLKTFHEISKVAEKEDLRRVIIVFDNRKLTSYEFERILDTCPFKVEIFHICELFCNIARGAWHWEYRMITEDEKKELFFNNTKILKLNPKGVVARYFALERGQILHVKEHRKHQTRPMEAPVQAIDHRGGNAEEHAPWFSDYDDDSSPHVCLLGEDSHEYYRCI